MSSRQTDRVSEQLVRAAVDRALEEDAARHDVTTGLLPEQAARGAEGRVRAAAPMVAAGLQVAAMVFRRLDAGCSTSLRVADGDTIAAATVLAVVHGPARALLAGERVALNFLQRLSGIATATRALVEIVAGTRAFITDTRKTTPGLRALEKYAVRVGGGTSHRESLADAILWKDNHWALLAESGETLDAVLRRAPSGMPVIVEVESETQLEEALAAGVKRILVDNQPPERLARWVRRAGTSVEIEASGGITAATVRAYAEAGARYISIGALTHSAPAADISFEIRLR